MTTKEQVMELTREVWGGSAILPFEEIEYFARLVGNAKLDEIAFRFEALHLRGRKTAGTKACAAIIRNMKEPTT